MPRAWAAASLNPAKALGVDGEIGSLAVGKTADIVIVNDKIEIQKTIIDGIVRYER